MLAMPILEELKQTRPFVSAAQEATVALLRTADIVNRLVDAVIGRHGITGQQYNVLRILRGAGDTGLPTLEIADRMIEQTPGITRLIDRLEGKKLVSRERCATDRRQVFCRISASGLALLARLDEPVRAISDEALRTLSKKDVAQLIELLDRTREGIKTTMLNMEVKS